jgi:hypothetical protein
VGDASLRADERYAIILHQGPQAGYSCSKPIRIFSCHEIGLYSSCGQKFKNVVKERRVNAWCSSWVRQINDLSVASRVPDFDNFMSDAGDLEHFSSESESNTWPKT